MSSRNKGVTTSNKWKTNAVCTSIILLFLLPLFWGCSSKTNKVQEEKTGLSPASLSGFEAPPLPSLPIDADSREDCASLKGIVVQDGHSIQTLLDNSPIGSTIKVPFGQYPSIQINQPLVLVGLSEQGRCADLNDSNQGPRFEGIQVSKDAEGTRIQGVRIETGGLSVRGKSLFQDVEVQGGDICIELHSEAEGNRFIAHKCRVGVLVHSPSILANGIIAENTDNGLVVNAPSTLHQLTVARNGKNGIILEAPGSRLFNSILAENKRWGLFEQKRALLLEHLSFAGNSLGHYGGAEENLLDPPLEWEDSQFIAITLTQGDRKGTEPALATQAIIRAELARKAPWNPKKSSTSLLERYRPVRKIQSARKAYKDPVYDVANNKRVMNTRVGAIEGTSEATRSPRQWYVTKNGKIGNDGQLQNPLQSIQEAVDRAAPGDVINVLPGRYSESVLVKETHISIRGVRIEGQKIVPIVSPEESPRPIIDPSLTGTHEQGLFLQDTLYGMSISGMSIEKALTGLTVIGRIDDIPPEPNIEAMLFQHNQKGMDADCGGGLLKNCSFKDNGVGATFRAGNHWKVTENTFYGPGPGVVFSMLITHGFTGFTLEKNSFLGAGIYVDSLHGRHGASLTISENLIENAPLSVRHGSPTGNLHLKDNQFTKKGHLALHEPQGSRPPCIGCLKITECKGFCVPQEKRNPGLPIPADERTIHPYSAPIAITKSGGKVIAVGADYEGVSIYRPNERQKPLYLHTGKDPRTVAISMDDQRALVTNFGAGTLSIIDLVEEKVMKTIDVGVEPYGVVFSPSQGEAWVTLSGEGALAVVDLKQGVVTSRIPVGAKPRGISLDFRKGQWRALITHFTPRHKPEETPGTLAGIEARLTVLMPTSGTEWNQKEIPLPPVASEHFPSSVPVLMQSVVVRGKRAYLPSFGATPERPSDAVIQGRKLLPFETAVQALLTVVDLETDTVIESETSNLNAPGRILNGPYGIAFAPGDSEQAMIPVYGNNAIARFDMVQGEPPRPKRAFRGSVDIFVGTNPRGVVIHPKGHEAYTVNFASGDLSIVDLKKSQTTRLFSLGPPERDRLSRLARQGKELFYTTQRVDTVADFWFTCGTCHPDGRTDGVTWNFSNGPRSTPVLAASLDTLPLHFDGDRDEFSDFEHTVRDLQGGFSLDRKKLKPALGEPSSKPLAHGWRAMEAYIREGVDSPRVPPIKTEEEEMGRKVFISFGCDTCHGGEWFAPDSIDQSRTVANGQVTDTLENINTKTERDLLGDGSFDPPSLWGLAQTGPYLHDGSSHTLEDVLKNQTHRVAGLGVQGKDRQMTPKETRDLIVYLGSITEGTEPP